uniref:Uncharacterized protein n=1 Tax=Fundulus heteroclitus TaxID=8078 RepID=A0A3Q2QBC2_FUNHE
MDEHFRIKFLFQKVSSEDFIESCDDQLQRMKDFLNELEECANQIDRVNRGAKISSKTTLVGGITGCALSVAGVALSPVTAGLSLGLTVAGVSMGAVSSTGKLVTTLTEIGINRSQLKKAVDVLKSFVEDFQMIQYCLNQVINQPTENLKPKKIDVVGVGKASEAVLQHGPALQNISRQALHVIDIGQAAHLGPLSKGDGFAELNCNRTKIPNFLKDRAALFRSQVKSWEEIRTSCSKLTTEENKNILQAPFYPGIKKTWI